MQIVLIILFLLITNVSNAYIGPGMAAWNMNCQPPVTDLDPGFPTERLLLPLGLAQASAND